MAKRYFEIELDDSQYNDLISTAAGHGLNPADMLKCVWECRNSPEIDYKGEQINELTSYLIEENFYAPIDGLLEYVDKLKKITDCRERLGRLYYAKLKGMQDEDFEEDVENEIEILSAALEEKAEIWNAIGIADSEWKQCEQEELTRRYVEKFLHNIIEE